MSSKIRSEYQKSQSIIKKIIKYILKSKSINLIEVYFDFDQDSNECTTVDTFSSFRLGYFCPTPT